MQAIIKQQFCDSISKNDRILDNSPGRGSILKQKAKKSLGQHFLKDRQAIQRITHVIPEAASVIEIGPGPGALTETLLPQAAKLAVIEMDDHFAEHWQHISESNPSLSVIHGDVMEELETAVASIKPDWIIGNLPYNISGPLTAKLAGLSLAGGMVLMYQREVAARIAADAGSKTYGGLSVLVRHHYDVKRLLTLPPEAFAPPPKVHSAVIVLTPHSKKPPCSYALLQQTVRQGFAHRRKTIRNNFRGQFSTEQWESININPGHRPEQLDYMAWTRIALALEEYSAGL
jgi:16S rRNA (adenine1518-N6/adenine1519-N6)-dimethyltransferase